MPFNSSLMLFCSKWSWFEACSVIFSKPIR
jgi:hypothetical protein